MKILKYPEYILIRIYLWRDVGLILQEDDFFCFDKESEGITQKPSATFIDENNILRVNEETKVANSNRLGAAGLFFTVPNNILAQFVTKFIKGK